jgi:site-specific recombinase XerD
VTTKKGLRNRAMLAILLSCGLRRSEVAALTMEHIQQRDNRWCIVDLVGKHGRVSTPICRHRLLRCILNAKGVLLSVDYRERISQWTG